MPLIKTTIVPPSDPVPVFNNRNAIKMVIVINDQNIVQIADNLAQHPPIADRLVVWFPNGLSANYQTIFNIADLTSVVAFSVKLDGISVADIIRLGETVDYVRISLAYYNAGK